MTRFHLVRHGRATGGWDDDPDPGLDDRGGEQAMAAAERLAPLGLGAIVTSPLRRCRETAQPLASRWAVEPEVVAAVAEIPSPSDIPFGERVPWLRRAMAGTWAELGHEYMAFRDGVVAALTSLPEETVVFSHFIAINVVIGACLGDDRVVIDSLDNASVTVIDVDGSGQLHLIERGRQANTLIR